MRKILLAPCVMILTFAAFANAARADDDAGSHLPLPRFAALRSAEVNMRTGPGTRYPIEWVYTRRGLPVEVIAEYDVWRRVRDSEGAEGWINRIELTGKRAAIVTGDAPTAPPPAPGTADSNANATTPASAPPTKDLHDDADDSSAVVAHVQAGAIGDLISCAPVWCKLKFGDVKGYMRKSDLWGAYPDEKFD
ncbi:MAG: hypothetical protein KGI37_06825 [Alphaproteobacteria bacterium]|nr:hypothetical protein [Alphaproteobacteria bacterium]